MGRGNLFSSGADDAANCWPNGRGHEPARYCPLQLRQQPGRQRPRGAARGRHRPLGPSPTQTRPRPSPGRLNRSYRPLRRRRIRVPGQPVRQGLRGRGGGARAPGRRRAGFVGRCRPAAAAACYAAAESAPTGRLVAHNGSGGGEARRAARCAAWPTRAAARTDWPDPARRSTRRRGTGLDGPRFAILGFAPSGSGASPVWLLAQSRGRLRPRFAACFDYFA